MTTIHHQIQAGQRLSESDRDLAFFDSSENQAWKSVRGFLSPAGAKALYRHAYESDPRGEAVEIGSLSGKSTVCIARALRDSKKGSRLTAIDIHFQPDFRENLKKFGVSHLIDLMEMPSVNAAEGWGKRLSFIYIDGGHGNALAFADLMVWDIPLMVGGVMALDDTYGFFVGSALQLQAAVRSGAYEPLGNFGGISFLRKQRPVLANVGDFPMRSGSLVAYVDFIGSWIGAMDLNMRLPIGAEFGPMSGRRSLKYLTNRIMDTSPRAALSWVAGKLAVVRAARQQRRDPRTHFLDGACEGPIRILQWLEAMPDLDEQAHATLSYLRACLEIQRLNLSTAIELLKPLWNLTPIPMPHYNIEIRQLASLRLAQAYDLAGNREQAESAYRRLTDKGTIVEIRHQAEIGLSQPFRLPEPVAHDVWVYVVDSELFRYKNLV